MRVLKAISVLTIALLMVSSVAFADTVTLTLVAINNPNSNPNVITPAISTAAAAAQAGFVGASSVNILEDFGGFGQCGGRTSSGYQSVCSNGIATGAGTFTAASGAGTSAGNHDLSLSILSASPKNTPFNGRYDVTPGVVDSRGKWLDSNDVANVHWAVSGSLTNIFFFMTDVDDQHGELTITLNDGTSQTFAMAPAVGSGDLYFVGIRADGGIASIDFHNTLTNDGWGIDHIGTAAVPEPSSLVLLGSGLLMAGRKLKKYIVA